MLAGKSLQKTICLPLNIIQPQFILLDQIYHVLYAISISLIEKYDLLPLFTSSFLQTLMFKLYVKFSYT